jgi:hypothetical protein
MKNKQELKDEFYKDCGQWCCDVHDQIADWWIDRVEGLIEDEKFKHLVPMKTCEHGGEHKRVPGVMYYMCSECRGLYAVRDEAFIKERGELPIDFDYELK